MGTIEADDDYDHDNESNDEDEDYDVYVLRATCGLTLLLKLTRMDEMG